MCASTDCASTDFGDATTNCCAVPYVLKPRNTNDCADGEERITSEAVCRDAAATALALDGKVGAYKGHEDAAEYPAGCYVFEDDSVYFNNHSEGGLNKDSAPLCKVPQGPHAPAGPIVDCDDSRTVAITGGACRCVTCCLPR